MEGCKDGYTADELSGVCLLLSVTRGCTDKVYPIQQLMRNKGNKFKWNERAQVSFENINREPCEAPYLGMPTEKDNYVLDTDASALAISGSLPQEQ